MISVLRNFKLWIFWVEMQSVYLHDCVTLCCVNYTFMQHKITILKKTSIKHLNPTGHVMHQQLNIQQLYALPTLYLCVLYFSENKQRIVPLIS